MSSPYVQSRLASGDLKNMSLPFRTFSMSRAGSSSLRIRAPCPLPTRVTIHGTPCALWYVMQSISTAALVQPYTEDGLGSISALYLEPAGCPYNALNELGYITMAFSPSPSCLRYQVCAMADRCLKLLYGKG